MKTYGLSERDLKQMLRTMKSTKRKVSAATEKLVRELLSEGIGYMIKIVPEDTQYTMMSITSSYDPETGVGKILVGSEYAIYLEYGTGVVGARNPHPDPDGWRYDVNGHGDSGWWYPIESEERAKHLESLGVRISQNKKTGRWYGFTRGLPGSAFIYNTAKHLSDIAGDRVKVVLKGV